MASPVVASFGNLEKSKIDQTSTAHNYMQYIQYFNEYYIENGIWDFQNVVKWLYVSWKLSP